MQMKSPANQNFTALNTMVSAFVFPFHDKIPLSDCPPLFLPLADEQLQVVLVVSVAA